MASNSYYHSELFKDSIVLVTGGRSGIGFAIAQQMLNLGAKVFICSRKEEALKEAAKDLSKFGPCAWATCDIRNTDQIRNLAQNIKEEYGRLDILVNNAGGQFPAPAELISENGWAAVINNNLNGTFYMSQIMANHFFIPQKKGVIVNIIANMFRGFPGMAHTGAARAGVENLTKSLALEWAEYNIRVNSVAPGTIESSGLDQYPKEIQDRFEAGKAENLMGRFGSTEDIANAVSFFASPISSYISGTTLYVDGCEHLAGDRLGLIKTLREMMK